MHATLALIAALCFTVAPASSRAAARLSEDPPPRVLYDQRQEGGWNVRADLKNFVVVIIPKAAEPQETGLLDLLTRAHRPPASSTAHFIQSKTAPYHVDISKASSHLRNDEILATQSPPPPEAAQVRQLRFAKTFVLTVPEEQLVLTEKVVKKGGEEMTLLGAAEQCGPDMARDAKGVCRLAH